MRGEVLEVDRNGEALVSGDDGARYRFLTRDVHRFIVQRGDRIDFVPVDGVATEIIHLSSGRGAMGSRPSRSHLRNTDDTSPWGYFIRCLSKYADAHGRARRKEYWYFVLFHLLIVAAPLLIGLIIAGMSGQYLSDASALAVGLFAISAAVLYAAMLAPGICAMIRRFHDVGLTGWLVLLGLIPYAGGLITFVITLLPSQPFPNKHGPVPAWSKRDTAEVFS
ncbi:MAG: DUF805 domain-containing protein [Brevundimonas sp.]